MELLSELSIRDTRQSSIYALYISKQNLELTKKFFYRGAKLWNTMHVYVQMAPTLEFFKELLYEWYDQI